MDEREQVREVCAASASRLVSQLYALTGDFLDAQDAVHEAFARAMARPGRLRQVDNPGARLRPVAMNVARSRHRRRAIFDRLVSVRLAGRPEPAPGLSPDHVALVAACSGWHPRSAIRDPPDRCPGPRRAADPASVLADGTLLIQVGLQAGDNPVMLRSTDSGQTVTSVPVGPGAAVLPVTGGGYARSGWPNSSGVWLSATGADWSYVGPPTLP